MGRLFSLLFFAGAVLSVASALYFMFGYEDPSSVMQQSYIFNGVALSLAGFFSLSFFGYICLAADSVVENSALAASKLSELEAGASTADQSSSSPKSKSTMGQPTGKPSNPNAIKGRVSG